VKINFSHGRLRPDPAKPTIAEALAARLGREPTHNELVAEARRILRFRPERP
jgi:hypothetical protein